jgi:superoxide dismutase
MRRWQKKPELQKLTLAELLRDVDRIPQEIRTAVINNGGGHLNHDIFWNSMTPRANQQPQGALADAIAQDFGSFDEFARSSVRLPRRTSRVVGSHCQWTWRPASWRSPSCTNTRC